MNFPRFLATAVVITSLIEGHVIPADKCDSYLGCYDSDAPLGVYTKASVATDAAFCAPIGRQILQKKGNAIDAAIATLLCMGVVIPESMGIGGGAFITFYNSTSRKATIIDAREVAPLNASVDMFKGNGNLSEEGALAIGVPGELAGYWEAHQRYGKLPWKLLFEGAVELAEKGFIVGHHLADAMRQDQELIRRNNVRKLLINPKTGDVYKKGELFRRPVLAQTLRTISEKGAAVMYSGEMASKIVEEIQDAGGIITLEDMKSYKPRVYEALKMELKRNMTLYGVRPPGSGALLGFILNVMGGYDDFYPQAKKSLKTAGLYYHRLAEAWKYAYSRRMHLGDEHFDDVQEMMDNLTSTHYADYIRGLIDDNKTFDPDHYLDSFQPLIDHGTSSMSVIDEEGNSVAVTTTVNLYFGSKFMSESTGIILNNQMDDFSSPNITNAFGVPPSDYNHIAPGKKPMSSMCPSVIVDTDTGKPILIVGGEGGTQITTSVSLVILRTLLFKESIKKCIDSPRIHHQLYPNQVLYEPNLPANLMQELAERGHTLVEAQRDSAVTAISFGLNDGLIYANTDYNKGGSIDGF